MFLPFKLKSSWSLGINRSNNWKLFINSKFCMTCFYLINEILDGLICQEIEAM